MRVVVIGGGPMGVAAAIGAADRGHDVTLLERSAIGASLLTWGDTRFFSPLRMNVSARMRELLGAEMPDPESLLTGPEYVERILLPLSRRAPLEGRVRTSSRVVAIGRRGLTRGDFAGHPLRAERPFRLLVVAGEGETGPREETLEAEIVLDASGGLLLPREFGAGGLPPAGASLAAPPPIRTLGALAAAAGELKGRRVLLVGSGHSAANAMLVLERLAGTDPALRVVWAVRTANRRPCEEVPNDPLPERERVVAAANRLAADPPPFLRVERRAMVERIESRNDALLVTLTGGRTVEVDRLAAFTGYRPDSSFLTELAVDVSPVTEGGARLNRAVSSISDCLSVPSVRPEDLESGEPGFFFVGSRGYGRSSSFLLSTGMAQLETLLESISR